MHAKMCPFILLVEQANTRTPNIHTNLRWLGDRAFCAYAPRLWNELPDNIKAADSMQTL